MSALKESINKAGGVANAATICEVSQRAIYKWLTAGVLPRTEYTGETDYALRLAEAAAERGNPFDATWLLAEASPKKSVA
ncbi:hypothetical protein [Azotobacter vinelandii]|uniref:hypothetical protein n=1 Tax=Azotobacter vinelandii TaxID=354 RepID=UPI0026664C36|nr:hypothetical protein [Azotobacter vinelandii]WKN20845.1 helix-turn-helix domain-containing protein [Azotobacter vinelandii]